MDYSQDREQEIILKHFEGKPSGRLLDIGASDGVGFSNSRALMEAGWSGVLVEPCARLFAKLVELYLGNPNAELINAAVSKDGDIGLVEMQYAMDTVVSTCDKVQYEAWKDSGRYRTIHVGTVSTFDIVQACPEGFAFINIDAEGWSFDIAKRLLNSYSPSIWCIENDPGFAEFEKRMNLHGYKHTHTTQSNSIWEKE